MATGKLRGIGNLGEIRRPPPFRFFLQLYRREIAFQALVDFVVLGTLTIAFLHPQQLLHPFTAKGGTAPQQQIATPSTPAAVAPPPAAAPPQAAPASTDTPS